MIDWILLAAYIVIGLGVARDQANKAYIEACSWSEITFVGFVSFLCWPFGAIFMALKASRWFFIPELNKERKAAKIKSVEEKRIQSLKDLRNVLGEDEPFFASIIDAEIKQAKENINAHS